MNEDTIEIICPGRYSEFSFDTYLYFDCMNCGCAWRIPISYESIENDCRFVAISGVVVGRAMRCPQCGADTFTNNIQRFL